MKSALILALTGVHLGIAFDKVIDEETNKEYEVISATELSEVDLKQFCRGDLEGQPLSIENTTLSFDIELGSNIFDGKTNIARKVKVLKPCFMKCEKGIHYFSSDYVTWKRFKEFFDIDLDASIDMCQETNLIKLIVHLNIHQNDE